MTAPSASEMMAYLARTSATPVSVLKRIAKPGDYKIRLLPGTGGSYEFRRKYSQHYIPRNDGIPGKYRFICDKFTNDTRCVVCDGYWNFVNDKKAKEASGRRVDPVLERVIGDSRASVRYLVNAIVQGENGGKPVVLEVTKTTMDRIETYLNTRNYLLWDFEAGQSINFQFRQRSAGPGLEATVIDLDPVKPVEFGVSDLHNLDDVLFNEVLRGAHPTSAFSGDFLNPLRPSAPAIAAPVTGTWAPSIGSGSLAAGTLVPSWDNDLATPPVAPGITNAPGVISREELNAVIRETQGKPASAPKSDMSEVDAILAEMTKMAAVGASS